MASIGSVELELKLDRAAFDKELTSLSKLEVAPLTLDLKLDAKSLNKQLKDLKGGDYGCLELEICPDIKGLSRKLKELPKSLVDCIPVEICPELNTELIKKQFNDLAQELQVKLTASIKASTAVAAPKSQTETPAKEKLEADFDKIGEKLNSAISNALKKAAGVVAAPFGSILRGAFEGIGQNLTRELSNSAIRSFQKTLDVSFKSVGGGAGGVAAREVGKALGLKTVSKPRATEGKAENQSTNASPSRKRQTSTEIPETALAKELKRIGTELGTFATIVQKAGLGSDKFGASSLKAAKEALELAAAFEGLRQGITAKKSGATPPQATSKEKTAPVVQTDQNLNSSKRGFLKGDVTRADTAEAKKQVEKVRDRLNKQLTELESLPISNKTSSSIGSLVKKIASLNDRIATDIANPDVPKAVRQSLGQLKATNSKLAEIQNNAIALQKQVASNFKPAADKTPTNINRKLPGIATKAATAGGIGATVLGAGGAFAAPAGGAGLGLLGALPFDPTLGLAAGGLAAAFAAAKFTPKILRKVGAGKAADILETDVGKIAGDAVRGIFTDVNNSVKKSFQSFGKRFQKFVGLGYDVDALPQDAVPTRRRARVQSASALIQDSPILNRGDWRGASRSPVNANPSTPRALNNEFERFFRGLEARFFRSPVFNGVAPRDRRSVTAEAGGFLASGAALAAPGTTAIAIATPVLAALTPLIATIGLVAGAIGPLIGTVAETLKQIQPLQSRFEFLGGGKEQGKEQQNFVRGVTDELNIPLLSSLEGFSKLAAAARKTKLEGEPLKELFEGIATGAKGLQLNTEDLNLVMFAFTQVLSKGKLSAEEVRLQIAERLPGAVGIFARAIGKTEAEFNKLLESGSLIAEDVLPKVGKQLKLEFGDAAAAASNTFVSSLTKVENAVFKLKEGFSAGLAPILTIVTNTFGDVLNFFATNAKTVFSIFSVILAGVSAQFFVGLTQILERSGLLAKVTGFLGPLFARVFATLTPFAVGIFADFLDDIFGAKTSVFENLTRGAYNSFLGLILVLDGFKVAIADFFSSLGQNDVLSGTLENIAFALRKVGDGLLYVYKFIGGTTIEFTALSLILAQTYVLIRAGLNLVLARLGTTMAALGASFATTATRGKVLQSVLTTMTAGLNKAELAATAALAVFILFFSKADFSNELGSKFDELGSRIADNFNKMAEGAKVAGSEFDKLKPPDFKSKGFDLTLGLGDFFGDGAFRTDDIIKQFEDERSQKQNLGENLLRYGPLGSLFSIPQVNEAAKNPKTIAEKQFEDNVSKANQFADQSNQAAGIVLGNFNVTESGKNLAQLKRFDEQIRLIQGRRSELLTGKNKGTEEVKKQVADIDSLIESFLKKRSEIVIPIEISRDAILNNLAALKSGISEINLRTDIPEQAKARLRQPLLNAIVIAESAKKKLEELGAIDLSPLGNEFVKVTIEIEKANLALEKSFNKITLNTTRRQTKTAIELSRGKITPEIAARENTDTELADLKSKGRTLEDFVKKRTKEIARLSAIPKPTIEQTDAIAKYQKEVEGKELELANNRLQVANKIVEGKKQAEARILKDFQFANAEAANTINKIESARIERIKRRQLSGAITSEEASIEIQDAGITSSKATVLDAKSAIVEFQKIKKTGKISSAEITARELELNKLLSDAILRSLDAEIAKREQLKQKRIADLEEIRNKEQSAIDISRTNAANLIKEQQLSGELTSTTATDANIKADIAAASGTLVVAKKRLDDIKKLRAEGLLNAKESAQKEREAISGIAAAEGQILDLRLQQQQQFRMDNLNKISEANNRAISLIDKQQAEADKRVSLGQLEKPISEDSDRKAEADKATNQRNATRSRITQAQKDISQLSRANFETEAQYTDKRTELEIGLTNLVRQGLDERRELEKRNQDEAILAIDRRIESEKNSGDLAVQNLEDQKAGLDLLNSSLDRSKQLLESRASVSKAITDAAVVSLEIALEAAPDTQKQQLSISLQNAKVEALKQEQVTARELLELDTKRQKLSAQMAISETEIAQSRALIAQLEAVGELEKATAQNDARAIASAQTKLELQNKIVAATDKQLENAQANLAIQDELAGNASKVLSIQQQSALAQGTAALRSLNKPKEINSDTKSKVIADTVSPVLSEQSSLDDTGKKPKKLSLFEQSRQNMFAPQPIQTTKGLPPEYFNLKAETTKASTLSTGSSKSGISAESEFNAMAGLKPGESVENLLKRQLGLDPTMSAEAYDKLPKSLFYGQDRTGTLEELNKKYAPKANSLGQLQEMYKPKANSLGQLQEMYKPDARNLDELNKKYAIKENTSAQFSDALKSSVRGLEDRLDKLNQNLVSAINSPRSLYVSSPEPITDAVSILADINRMNVQSSGLG